MMAHNDAPMVRHDVARASIFRKTEYENSVNMLIPNWAAAIFTPFLFLAMTAQCLFQKQPQELSVERPRIGGAIRVFL